ncbi:ribonuclease H-like domain-containing protein [Sorangium sp. So ce394]|uniref:ribonuclease H-like domain-containing protein n=1 Tax=Sorangium sp. So ce394 TaxID=3133310 RepID=UPI003F5AEF4A
MTSFKSKLARLGPLPAERRGSAPLAPAPALARDAAAADDRASAPPPAPSAPPPVLCEADAVGAVPAAAGAVLAVAAPAEAARPRPAAPGAPAGGGARPSLDELRDRISRIVARGAPPTPRADPARGELPFHVEQTPGGPLYVSRTRSLAAARVGRAPLVAARDADPAMLALLALDPALAGCDVRRALFLDTETTGLAGGTGTVPFLIGLAWFDPGAASAGPLGEPSSDGFVMEQLLLRRLGEEEPILRRLAERLEGASMIITYNGKAFDMPLLRTRYVMNRLPPPPELPHLDLVHVARRIHKARLKTRTLIALEHDVLGRVRVGDVPGGEIVACYAHFLRTGDEEALLGVVEHNAADVLAMVALVGLYGEPLGSLAAGDLAGVAATLRRAGALERAAELADAAVERGGGAAARRARGDIAKARGDKARALSDYEALAAEIDDPAVRLELAKLYEHHVRAFARALDLADQGTAEPEPAQARRRARLRRKLDRATGGAAALALPFERAVAGGADGARPCAQPAAAPEREGREGKE